MLCSVMQWRSSQIIAVEAYISAIGYQLLRFALLLLYKYEYALLLLCVFLAAVCYNRLFLNTCQVASNNCLDELFSLLDLFFRVLASFCFDSLFFDRIGALSLWRSFLRLGLHGWQKLLKKWDVVAARTNTLKRAEI